MPLIPSPRTATRESTSPTVRHLQIFVLFNGKETTAAALRKAERFVSGLGGDILIAAPHVVPYPLPLNHPAVDRRALLEQIKNSVLQSGITCQIQKVLVAYTRDNRDVWRDLLPPHCIVVIGKPKLRDPILWLNTSFLMKSLSKSGYEVVLA